MQQNQPDLEKLCNRADSEKPSELQQQDAEKLQKQHQISQQQAIRFVLAQILVTITLFAILFIFDRVVAYSSLTGGLIASLANAWFALKVFRVKPTVAENLLSTMYVGEIYKFVLTGTMFVIAFSLIKPISVVALLLTYLLIHMVPAVQNVLTKD